MQKRRERNLVGENNFTSIALAAETIGFAARGDILIQDGDSGGEGCLFLC